MSEADSSMKKPYLAQRYKNEYAFLFPCVVGQSTIGDRCSYCRVAVQLRAFAWWYCRHQ